MPKTTAIAKRAPSHVVVVRPKAQKLTKRAVEQAKLASFEPLMHTLEASTYANRELSRRIKRAQVQLLNYITDNEHKLGGLLRINKLLTGRM